jgi:hypothetical protein
MLFISYASADRPFVQGLSADVSAAGIETWVDREDLVPGDRWRGEIVAAIEACEALVVVLSRASSASREVPREVEAADRRRKRIIPVIKEACDPRNMELVLSERHWIDFSTGDYAGGVRQLVEAMQGHGTAPPVSPMSYQPATRQIVGSWRVWIQHPMLPGFGSFHFYPNGAFYGEQSQQTGAVQIQGQWAFNGTFIRVQGMTNVGFPYNLMLQIIEQGQGYFKAASHDGFAVLFQWAA